MELKGKCPVTGNNETIETDDIYAGTLEDKDTYLIGRVICPMDCKLPECPILKQYGMKVGSSYQV